MITTGIKNANNSSESLLSILADPKKAEATLKKIVAENKKLVEQTKALMKAKSVTAYCKEKEKEAEKAKEAAKAAIDEVVKAKKEFDSYKNRTNTTLAKRVADAAEKEEAAMSTLVQANKANEEIVAKYKLLEKDLAAVEIKERKAEAIKQEYTDKLNDLKERMRGL